MTATVSSRAAIRQAELEHMAVGLSHWQPEIDGFRYRLAGGSFALYLPADGTCRRSAAPALRRAAADPLVVAISVTAGNSTSRWCRVTRWQQIRLQLPRKNRRFVLVEFDVSPSRPDGARVLFVGKTEPR